MTWTSARFRSRYLYPLEGFSPPIALSYNDVCFIRKDHKCGKLFGASKSCFVACPTDKDLEIILNLITEKLAKVGIEANIAIKDRAYGQDIFCTKICGKIIESQFCLVILDDIVKDSKAFPNPNVYYEYGLMTSLKKHIIPLQKDDLKLAFNIQSYDTIKYNSSNIGFELDRAIKDAINITRAKNEIESDAYITDKTILRSLELANFELKTDTWLLWKAIEDTNYLGFGYLSSKFYIYLGRIDELNEVDPYLEDLNVVIYRTDKIVETKEKAISKAEVDLKGVKNNYSRMIEERNKEPGSLQKMKIAREEKNVEATIHELEKNIEENRSWLERLERIYIGFIVNPRIETKEFVEKCENMTRYSERYRLSVNIRDEIQFGDVSVKLKLIPL